MQKEQDAHVNAEVNREKKDLAARRMCRYRQTV